MSIQSWLLFLHILGAIIWIGAGAAVSLIGMRMRRSPDRSALADFARTLRYVGLRAFMPAFVVVLATGLLMVLAGSRWKISQPWILGYLSVAIASGAHCPGAFLLRASIAA